MLPPEIIIVQNRDSSDYNEYIASTGDDSHEYTLEDGDSTSGDGDLEDPHCVRNARGSTESPFS